MILDDEKENSTTESSAAAAPAPEHHRVVEVHADDTLSLLEPITYGMVRSIAIGVLESPAGHAVLIKLVENFVGQWLFANPPVDQVVAIVQAEIGMAVENAKADILAHLTPMITAIVAGKTPPPIEAAAPEHSEELEVPMDFEPGDPVKVWTDAEHKTFREGEIVAAHDGAHAFDVKLDDDTVTKVGADGLEYDDRR